jgi:hypothetical protein
MKAVEQVLKSPWRTIFYIFDKEIMEVFTAMNRLLSGKTALVKKDS